MQAQPAFKPLDKFWRQKLKLKIKNKNNTFYFSYLSFLSASSKIHLLSKENFNPNLFNPVGLY